MHLQSLELFGFKSFPDKTVFHFHEGITAIVGPNGCGKSNLLDAVRWVLGEQSAKSLRGGEMADVIFNGTDTRKPLGFAEVSLTLTDCPNELGVEWHDVRVTRRVYRDGNSEYFLNKTTCRLRDIQNLFADTGVARSAYSMMEQGKIDLILSSRPEDRRAVFEEAAGITKYKAQKREALRKLEATEANLLRIGDIIKEVKRQIGSLQRQAGKARRYQTLLADLQVLDTHLSKKQLGALDAEVASCRAEIERLNGLEQDTRSRIEKDENTLAEKRTALDQVDDRIADNRADLQRLQTEIGTHRSRIEFNRQRTQEWTELIERARNDITAAEPKQTQQAEQIQEADLSIEQIERLLKEKQAELAQLTELNTKLQADRLARNAELQELQLFLSKNEMRTDTLEDELSSSRTRREATSERARDLANSIVQASKTAQDALDKISLARAATETEQKNLEQLRAETEEADHALQQRRQLLSGVEKSLIALERALAEKESRLEVLRQLNAEGEGLTQGSQAVLKGIDDYPKIQRAVVGSLVAQLDVDPAFVPAIEAALGRNVHAIVLRKASAASEILTALNEKKLGQVALILPELTGSSQTEEAKALPPTALAWARDKVGVSDDLAPLVKQLLHNVAVFRDFEAALRAKDNDHIIAAATLSGEFISPEGIIFGGAAPSESLLERKARISILSAEHSVLKAQGNVLRQKCEEAKEQTEVCERRVEEMRVRHHAAQAAQSTAGTEIILLERESETRKEKVRELESEKAILSQQILAADERIEELEKELAVGRGTLAEKRDRHSAAETAQTEATAQEKRTASRINELQLALATEQQRYDHLLAQRQPMIAREAELSELIATRRADVAAFEKRLESQGKESTESEAAIEKQTAQIADLESHLSALTNQRSEQVSAISTREGGLRALRNSLNELHDERAAQQVRESQLQMKIDNLGEHVERRYHVDLRGFVPDQPAFEKILRVQLKRRADVNNGGDDASDSASVRAGQAISEIAIHAAADTDAEKLIADLTRQLDNMGPVNLEAVQEYDELEERYRFLETQNNDLTTSRRELLDVIARINSTTQKLFAETFAQVRVNFREMFAELFGGGRADLVLMDENDALNCGIEISAKPPGKQLQSILLLSGGERTMTAVALLFAIYMVRPSPFCVLDELDAPLDESNINRFIRVLERFVAQSQFVIITHNKRTIAKADVLYGITMEERGVSKLVGMKLTERPDEPAVSGSESQADTPAQQRHFALAENGHTEQKQTFAAR